MIFRYFGDLIFSSAIQWRIFSSIIAIFSDYMLYNFGIYASVTTINAANVDVTQLTLCAAESKFLGGPETYNCPQSFVAR